MDNKKTIFFILDSFEYYKGYNNGNYTQCYSYYDTEEAINNNIPFIMTYDIGHLSFDLEDLGYTILIGYKGNYKRFYSGMGTANGKELRKAHNLQRLLIGGALDTDLNIERKKFWYDNSISTSDLCQQERNFQKAAFDCTLKVAQKTIGFDLIPMKFEDIGKEIKRLVERVTKGKATTNGGNGLTEPLIGKIKK